MKYFHIDCKIDKDLLNRFFDFCNANGEDEWTIIIYTVGGWICMGKTILRIINLRKDKVTLILHEAYSSGFYIFYEAKCKKVMCSNGKGMIHKAAAEMFIDTDRKPRYSEDACIIKNWKHSKKEDDEWANKFLTKKEFKKYKNGNEVYLTAKRMKQIFPEAEII